MLYLFCCLVNATSVDSFILSMVREDSEEDTRSYSGSVNLQLSTRCYEEWSYYSRERYEGGARSHPRSFCREVFAMREF